MLKYSKITNILIPILQTLKYTKRFTSSPSNINLVGKNYLKSLNFSSDETKSLLWTALDLKQKIKKNHEIDLINDVRITILMHEPCLEIQGAAMSAANLLKANLNVVIHPDWDQRDFVNDIGSYFSTCSDMMFVQCKYHSKIEKLAEGAAIPVVTVRSCTYAMLDALADIMAYQEKYGHLKDLFVGWIGRPCPLINTYLCLAPKLGINMQYCCACSPGVGMCPAALPLAKEISEKKHTLLTECLNPEQAIDKVHIIAVTRHNVKDFTIDLKHIEKHSNKNWSFIHKLPRGSIEVKPEVFDHKNSLVWEAKGNLQWIYAALMVRLLSPYEHVSKRPAFEKGESN